MEKRLQVVLAHAGVASRRKAAEIIEKKRVTVNGHIVSDRGFHVDPSRDRIAVDGKLIRREEKVYIVLNKPKGVVTTVRDELGRRTVMDLMSELRVRLYPVGRLDRDSQGVLLLTNDGELANRLSHPRHGVTKIYTVTIKGVLTPEAIAKLESGVFVDGMRTAPCKVSVLKKSHEGMILRIELHEGRKRQIRHMVLKVGGFVKKLVRISYAGVTAKSLAVGKYRMLTSDELKRLKHTCGYDSGDTI